MGEPTAYFFCGVGGSGMLPLAMIVAAQGHVVEGSDRSLDQGRTADKFAYLRAHGVRLHPQDGSGVTRPEQVVVASAAVEETVPDIAAANRVGATRMSRAELLARLFNAAPMSIGVAGTSGKSTTTAMLGWILTHAGRDPTIVNGAVMKNFVTIEEPFASARVGRGEPFVSEIDESDGSIARFSPRIAVLNNISLDHKSMEELRVLFGGFVERANAAAINLDDAETAAIAEACPHERVMTYSMRDPRAHIVGGDVSPEPAGAAFVAHDTLAGDQAPARLAMPGRHNVANALAAIAAARLVGVGLAEAAGAITSFEGVRRRMERVGAAGGVTVIDDFAHNPDKISASLSTLKEFPGRVLVMFQPHGFGPLRLTKDELIAAFAEHLEAGDRLVMPEPVYYGGTVQRVVTSEDIAAGVRGRDRAADALADRAACGERLLELAQPGDRIIVMGARDDTLSVFAGELLERLDGRG
ncbi:MAG: Mur ligase domain-containing protein [Caulobacterales bacterium]|nr:Mur ligase domain-containing protein [Caulobacterales bacterium]